MQITKQKVNEFREKSTQLLKKLKIYICWKFELCFILIINLLLYLNYVNKSYFIPIYIQNCTCKKKICKLSLTKTNADLSKNTALLSYFHQQGMQHWFV